MAGSLLLRQSFAAKTCGKDPDDGRKQSLPKLMTAKSQAPGKISQPDSQIQAQVQ